MRDFVLGLTGTPIENRLEDLWCIMDRVVPGYLGDLKTFSATHTEDAHDALKDLKAKLDEPRLGLPAIMLRRMKDQILVGLPEKDIKPYRVDMPSAQSEAYASAVREAQSGERSPGTMLKVIHALRSISLHPNGGGDIDPYDPEAGDQMGQRIRSAEGSFLYFQDNRKERRKGVGLSGASRCPDHLCGSGDDAARITVGARHYQRNDAGSETPRHCGSLSEWAAGLQSDGSVAEGGWRGAHHHGRESRDSSQPLVESSR